MSMIPLIRNPALPGFASIRAAPIGRFRPDL
jgi:hypothetical protein